MATTIDTGLTTSIDPAATTSLVNTNPTYDWYWDMEQADANWPANGTSLTAVYPSPAGSTRTTSQAYQGTYSIEAPAANFQTIVFRNPTNGNIFASTVKGTITFAWLYLGAYGNGSMLFQLSGKDLAGAGPLDTDDGMWIYTNSTGTVIFARYGYNDGVTNVNTPDLSMAAPGAGVWRQVTLSWNTGATRKMVLQLDQDPPTYSTTAIGATKCNAWHELLLLNDTTNNFNEFEDIYKISPIWVYTVVATVWQSFEFAGTVDATALQGSDHSPSATWAVIGTRMTTSTSGQMTNPVPVNFIDDTGTRGLAFDLGATAASSIELTTAAATVRETYFVWAKFPTIASGTTNTVQYSDDAVITHLLQKTVLRNTAGVLSLEMVGATTSSTLTISANTAYLLSYDLLRNAACTLYVYDSTGALVGSVSCTGANRSLLRFALGTDAVSTAQAGLTVYFDNMCSDSVAGVIPFKPWQ